MVEFRWMKPCKCRSLHDEESRERDLQQSEQAIHSVPGIQGAPVRRSRKRRSGRGTRQVVALDLVQKTAAGEAEAPGCPRSVAAVAVESLADHLDLEFLHG